MTTQNPRADSDRQHQNLREQLPWYVNQTLSEAERIEVGEPCRELPGLPSRPHDVATVGHRRTRR